MTEIVYDGSFEGFLTALFEVEEYAFDMVEIQEESRHQASLFGTVHQVHTNEKKAEELLYDVERHLGAYGPKTLFHLYLSEDPLRERLALHMVRYMRLHPDKNVLLDFSDSQIVEIQLILKKVHREYHRMKAFVRFAKLEDGTYFARIDPDFNVLPLIQPHFSERYQDQKWIIYDLRRRYGIYYDLETTEYWTPTAEQQQQLEAKDLPIDHKEGWYQQFWQAYFKKTNIKERRNDALHLRHVPRRYWKYLVEKNP